ncbi:mitochondrial import receptor subunit TOM40 homolog [Anopheles darlingi]|uniref:mitochondrial import receptor subunit TOM40 homolog n=1 Tax=Anopheles darlingi TaxID=43151 RepID=UPI0021004465|nr:mitochondrial import receptor subunit TOM40 homolog [Anopheles darlingi]
MKFTEAAKTETEPGGRAGAGSCVPEPDRRYGGRFPWPFTWTTGVRQPPLNPGDMANLHERIGHLRPLWFEGCQLNVTHGLGVNRTVGASWTLSHVTPSGFRFGGQYQRRCNDHVLKTPLVAFDVNPSTLASNLQLLYRPFGSVCLEANLQLLPGGAGGAGGGCVVPLVEEVSLQHTGRSRTSTVRYSSTADAGYRVSVDHLVSLTDRLCVGMELLTECYRQVVQTGVAFASRYNRETWTLAATVSPEACDLSYWRKVSDTLQLGTSVVINQRRDRAVGSICYRFDHPDTVVRGSFDTDWTLGFTYGRKLTPAAFSACFSLLFCPPKNTFQCGFRIDLDSNLL